MDDFWGYANIGTGAAFKYFYAYELTGELDDSGMEYIKNMQFEELPEVKNLLSVDWDGAPLDVTDDGISYLTLDRKPMIFWLELALAFIMWMRKMT